MKKISFIILMSLMLFLGISAAAKTEDLSFDEYTGEALSDDYVEENEDGISTCGAIIVDPGAGGSSDDELEMNDTLATAKSINSYLSYDEHNKCKFVKYLSIANHSNGNADTDCFYFTNSYINKYFSVSIDVPDFFKYYISLYSVQETSQGTKYVYVGNSSEVLSYSNLEIGSYVIKFSSRNNTQAGYCITISLERENSIRNQENNSEANATTIYEGIDKKIYSNTGIMFLKFYPSKTGLYRLSWDYSSIESIEIYEYIVVDNLVYTGKCKKKYKIYDNYSEVSLFQNDKNAERKAGYEGEHQYYICAKLKNNGKFFKISYKQITFIDNTKTVGENTPFELLFPVDDLSVFTTVHEKSNIEENVLETIIFDKMTQNTDYFKISDYNKIYGGINAESAMYCNNLTEAKFGAMHVEFYRYATINYLCEEDGDGETYMTDAIVNYMKFAICEDFSGRNSSNSIVVLMNYKYDYVYDLNLLALNQLTSDISLSNFESIVFSSISSDIVVGNFYSVENTTDKMLISNIEKEILEDTITGVIGAASSILGTLYETIIYADKIMYRLNMSESDEKKVLNKLPSKTKCVKITSSKASLSDTNIQFSTSSNRVIPYFPFQNELENSIADTMILNMKTNGINRLVEGTLGYILQFDIMFTSISGKDFNYTFDFSRNMED